jgi:hypothetical protein
MYKIVKPSGEMVPVYITEEDSHSIKIHLATDVSLCRWIKKTEFIVRDDLLLLKTKDAYY